MDKAYKGTILRGAQAWAEWIAEEEVKTGEAYGKQPDFLIADWNREHEIARDYEGREILELLQNANDQAAEMGEQGRVAILILDAGLVVANTGLEFSLEGVKSLQTSNLSPKRSRREHLIGNKGLGFRSILNWSNTPVILSGDLRLAFSEEYTRQKRE